MAFIIIFGNSMDGFTYYGPFSTREEALEWATQDGNIDADEWSITDLFPANDDHPENL